VSTPRPPLPAKLVVGLLFRDTNIHQQALYSLGETFGALDLLTEPEPFTFTKYYDREMGPGLLRQTLSFLDLVAPDTLAKVKLTTQALEQRLGRDGKRTINIDPGLLSEERLVLATGKNFTHRIYLRDGIYADLTLIYQKGGFQAFPWTYPDYQTPRLLHFLTALRQKLQIQRHGRLPTRIGGPFDS
jgi:hypothetical protein